MARMCVACRQTADSSELLRFATYNGGIVADPFRRLQSRGMHVHLSNECLARVGLAVDFGSSVNEAAKTGKQVAWCTARDGRGETSHTFGSEAVLAGDLPGSAPEGPLRWISEAKEQGTTVVSLTLLSVPLKGAHAKQWRRGLRVSTGAVEFLFSR